MLDVFQLIALRVDEEMETFLFHKEREKMWYTVQTTPTELARSGIKRYWVRLRQYRKAVNRDGKSFNKFLGFVHISDDLFPSRIEALRFGREEIKKRTEPK